MEANSIQQVGLENKPSIKEKEKKAINNHGCSTSWYYRRQLWFLFFSYIPMSGILMAFQDYKPALGFLIPNGSDLSISGTCGRTIISCKLLGIHCFLLAPKLF